ncbi:hypothetical protein [Aequorivita sp. CIP111184]|uniref:hypothetical protein n=1 Tax=Aequorivita sp. CIP111184 TaxID=2211356 RepID=UPI000DBC1A12|nr:hypothetical protein [Aequorivita sp. CIP111184]SRX54223.1 hypothetical protein AEQU1_01230 [Aequorivita sp. CIP111184]
MHKELLLKAFTKVREELVSEGINSPSNNQCAKELSSIISKSFSYGDRRLRDYYKKAKSRTDGDIDIPQQQVILALAQYLGYKDYVDFQNQSCLKKDTKEITAETDFNNRQEKEVMTDGGSNNQRRNNRYFWITISISFLLIISFFGYAFFTKQKWMEWEETHYVEASYDSEKLREGNLKVYKEERIAGFKKVTPNCDSKFFNDDGSVRIWYGKNKDGDLEYFTSYELHPLTGKTLKPITRYMIGKYICK